ncbi:methyltransferase domain-containing protein [Novosphingobium sp. JCM 18896]|uniref:methyltransferase domain-containing protein n=1 Tax=Novosphingobium sp. JCM 18896 TaxID=2989731 RepID=UPI002221AF30|nr:methyltransferase domain-containing protein [Novosphingobium sp. JCM 18896]MCW1430167.1 methyltransferase domain-containing protein [Novosphingobium sp. JCM 18896]
MADLSIRSRQEEQMDAPDLDPAVYARVLHDLARVNRWTFTAWPALAFLARAAGEQRRFRLLDVGFGDGDVLRAIHRWAERREIAVDLVGVDLNANSLAAARAATPSDMAIDYRVGDYRDQAGPFDFIISSQVSHHMTDGQLQAFIRHMEDQARQGWLICDLHRHGFAYWGYPLLARLLRVHRIVREDGRLSIARSFRPDEWRAILDEAGVASEAVRIRRRFAFRLAVERLCQAR